jgi:hypothetical protein
MEPTITARRKLTFNLGRYESMETEIFLVNIPADTEPEEISQQLDLLMEPEIERACLATSHADEDNTSSVYTWRDIARNSKEGS